MTNNNPDAVIVAATRTPIGRACKGTLRDMRPDDLAAQVVRSLVAEVPALDPSTIDDLIVGCGNPGGEQGFNIGRVVAILSGLRMSPAAPWPGIAPRRFKPSGWPRMQSALVRGRRSWPRAWKP